MDTLQISADSPHCCEVPHLQKPAGGHHHVPCQQFAESDVTDQWEIHHFENLYSVFFGGAYYFEAILSTSMTINLLFWRFSPAISDEIGDGLYIGFAADCA